MQSKITTTSKLQASNDLDGINFHLINLINKLGSEKANSLLSALSSDGKYASYDSILKELTASYFSISVEEVVTGATHWHAQVRGVCFYILSKNDVSVRSIGSFFKKRESAVHSQIKLMQSIAERPSKNKVFFKAFSEINIQFERFISIEPEEDELPKKEHSISYDDIRRKVKLKMKDLDISQEFLAKKINKSQQAVSDFLCGTRKLKLESILQIQEYLKIKLL